MIERKFGFSPMMVRPVEFVVAGYVLNQGITSQMEVAITSEGRRFTRAYPAGDWIETNSLTHLLEQDRDLNG